MIFVKNKKNQKIKNYKQLELFNCDSLKKISENKFLYETDSVSNYQNFLIYLSVFSKKNTKFKTKKENNKYIVFVEQKNNRSIENGSKR